MIWLLIWTASIIINVVVTLKFKRKDKGKITYADLFYFFIFGIVVAPLLTGFILVAGTIKLYNRLIDMNIMDKTIYRFK
jgi:hypothetical protein